MSKLLIALLIALSTAAYAQEPQFYNQYNRNDLTDYRNTGKGYTLLFLLDKAFGKPAPKAEWETKTPTIEMGQIQYIEVKNENN